MVYVVSDIHGNYIKYKKAWDTLALGEDDLLYVLGDVLDRGADSMEILAHMMKQDNIIPLAGNHEYMALQVLPFFLKNKSVEEVKASESLDFSLAWDDWMLNGGQITFHNFLYLSLEERREILEYLGEFSAYEELEIGGKSYVLAHAGISDFQEDLPLDQYHPREFLFGRADYSKMYFKDRILLTGHTPTAYIHDKGNVIFQGNGHIAIDCGCAFGGNLAVLCLDTMEEWYF